MPPRANAGGLIIVATRLFAPAAAKRSFSLVRRTGSSGGQLFGLGEGWIAPHLWSDHADAMRAYRLLCR